MQGRWTSIRKKKSIEVVDNANLTKYLVVTTPIVATEAYMNEIVVVGCLETNPLVCESGYIKVYKSRNASHSMSKLKEKMSRIEVEECMKAEANTFTIENRFKFPLLLIFLTIFLIYSQETYKFFGKRIFVSASQFCSRRLTPARGIDLLCITILICQVFSSFFREKHPKHGATITMPLICVETTSLVTYLQEHIVIKFIKCITG